MKWNILQERVQWEYNGVSMHKTYSWACIVFIYWALAHFSYCNVDEEACIGAE